MHFLKLGSTELTIFVQKNKKQNVFNVRFIQVTRHCRQYRGRVSMRSRPPPDPEDSKSSLTVLQTSPDLPDSSLVSVRPRKVSSCTTTSSTCTDSGSCIRAKKSGS